MPQIKGPGTLQPSQPLKERMADIRRAVELGAITNTNTTLHLDPECANVLLEMFKRAEQRNG